MIPSLEQSFKKRLQQIAKERNVTPAEVWQNVLVERFLVRLCASSYQSHFILKGGTLLAKYLKLGRETRDLDFTIKGLKDGVAGLQKAFDEIVAIDLNDGFRFSTPKVALAEQFQQYPGVQVKMGVHFGKTIYPLFVDLGFGDSVVAQEQKLLLLSQEVSMKCYPMEFIFAEKLETVIYRGSNNSRMKDFHDLYTIVTTENALQGELAEKATKTVFAHRKTDLHLPIFFQPAELETLQNSWARYRPGVGSEIKLPKQIEQVIEVLNDWMKQHFHFPLSQIRE